MTILLQHIYNDSYNIIFTQYALLQSSISTVLISISTHRDPSNISYKTFLIAVQSVKTFLIQ